MRVNATDVQCTSAVLSSRNLVSFIDFNALCPDATEDIYFSFSETPTKQSNLANLPSISAHHACNSFAVNENTFLCIANQSLLHEVIC